MYYRIFNSILGAYSLDAVSNFSALGQLKMSPSIVKCPLVGKIALVENHFEMQSTCKSQNQENNSPLCIFGQVVFNLGLQFLHLKKKQVVLDSFICLFIYSLTHSFIHSINFL